MSTLKVNTEDDVLFAQIAAPPMNLLGSELVHDLVSLIQHAEADNTLKVVVFKSAEPDYFRRDSDLFRESMGSGETQHLIQTALKQGFQTRDAEMDLGALLPVLVAERSDPPGRSTPVLTGEAT